MIKQSQQQRFNAGFLWMSITAVKFFFWNKFRTVQNLAYSIILTDNFKQSIYKLFDFIFVQNRIAKFLHPGNIIPINLRFFYALLEFLKSEKQIGILRFATQQSQEKTVYISAERQ